MALPISRCVSRFDSLVQRGNVIAEHFHDVAEISRDPSGFSLFIETSKLGFHLSSVFQGGRTLGSEEFQGGIQWDHLLSGSTEDVLRFT